jgi:hypothetical protein
MLIAAFIGTLILGLSMRRQQTWSTILLWVVPVLLILSATDGLLGALSGPFPTLQMDGGRDDSLRFGLCFLVLVFPCEIVYQLAVNWMTGGFTIRRRAGEDRQPPTESSSGKRDETP